MQAFLSKDHEFFLIVQCVFWCRQYLNLLLQLGIQLELEEIFSILLAIFLHSIQMKSKILIHQLVMVLRTILVNHRMGSSALSCLHFHRFLLMLIWIQCLHEEEWIFHQLLFEESMFFQFLSQLLSSCYEFLRYHYQLQN